MIFIRFHVYSKLRIDIVCLTWNGFHATLGRIMTRTDVYSMQHAHEFSESIKSINVFQNLVLLMSCYVRANAPSINIYGMDMNIRRNIVEWIIIPLNLRKE